MGENKTIYLHDDVVGLIEKELREGEPFQLGPLINQLLRDNFENTEEALREKVKIHEMRKSQAQAMLNRLTEDRLHRETKAKELAAQNEAVIKRQKAVDEMKAKWRKGEVSDEEYWAFIDNGKKK